MNAEFQKETEAGGVADLVNRRDVAPADLNFRWKGQDVTGQPARVAAAQEMQRRHNSGDHSRCTAQSCHIIARVEKENLAG